MFLVKQVKLTIFLVRKKNPTNFAFIHHDFYGFDKDKEP